MGLPNSEHFARSGWTRAIPTRCGWRRRVPGRRTRAYDEIGYYRAQGDNAASLNPPIGALLTYYLREDAPSGTKVVLSVTDATGKQVRQLDAVAKAGLHRTPWDLREAPLPGPIGPSGGSVGPQGRRGKASVEALASTAGARLPFVRREQTG